MSKKEKEVQNDETLALSIFTNLARTCDLLKKREKVHVESVGLTWGQFEVLHLLHDHGSGEKFTPTQIYTALSITSGGLTKMLSGLEKRGLIMRVNNQYDGRSQLIYLSQQGKALVNATLEKRMHTSQEFLDSVLKSKEQSAFLLYSERLRESLMHQSEL